MDREEEMLQKFKEEKIIEREYLNKIKQLVTNDVSLIITGVRRCGKSMLAFMLGKKENFAYVNFEDERLSNLSSANLIKFSMQFIS